MKKSFLGALAALILLGVIALAACGPAPNETAKPVEFNTLEDARSQARSNALFNAQAYRAENPRFTTHSIVTHGDSTQSPSCPQGSGWAGVSIMKVEGKEVEKFSAVCSTVSSALGCYLKEDFDKKPFATDADTCQPVGKVPFPIPKLAH